MAGKPRFRVPTLQEMDEAQEHEAASVRRPIFRQGAVSKPAASSSDAAVDLPQPKNSPPKRVISQKALLSRQPLSAQIKSMKGQISPKKSSPVSSEKKESEQKSTSSNSGSLLVPHRVSRVTDSNMSHAKLKPFSGTLNTDGNTTAKGNIASNLDLLKGNAAGNTSNNTGLSSRELTTEKDERTVNILSERQTAAGSSNAEEIKEQEAIRADVLPTLAKLGKTNSLVVSSKQRGNPILKYVRNVPWEYGNIVPDYVMGQSNCALFLSLRYHQLHPEYIHTRLKQLGHSFDLRVLLVQVDIKDPHHLLKDLAKICILADCTLMLAFSAEEAGRYLETYKVYENKAAEAIMEQTENNFSAQLTDCLTTVKSVNKTDCSTLLATFGNLQGIMGASVEDLSLCPGFGPQKAKRLHDVFREPFLVSKKQHSDTIK